MMADDALRVIRTPLEDLLEAQRNMERSFEKLRAGFATLVLSTRQLNVDLKGIRRALRPRRRSRRPAFRHGAMRRRH